jgi:hypothetical protein
VACPSSSCTTFIAAECAEALLKKLERSPIVLWLPPEIPRLLPQPALFEAFDEKLVEPQELGGPLVRPLRHRIVYLLDEIV